MEWSCAECGRTYQEPPSACAACGGDVVPEADPRVSSDRISLRAARERLLNPLSADTSLVDVDPRIGIAFRVVVVVVALVLGVILATLVLG